MGGATKMAVVIRTVTKIAVVITRMGAATSAAVGITIMINIEEEGVEEVKITTEVVTIIIILLLNHRLGAPLLQACRFQARQVLALAYPRLHPRAILVHHQLDTLPHREASQHLQCRVNTLLLLGMAITIHHLVRTVRMMVGEVMEATEDPTEAVEAVDVTRQISGNK